MGAATHELASRLHVEVAGSHGPLIVFESGSGADASVWRHVIRALGPDVRTFAYDRAGIGHSPASERPADAASAARDLIRALAAQGCGAPVVIVAHSLGALIARHVALVRPQMIAALILVEPVHEDMYERLAYKDPDGPRRRMRRAMVVLRGIELLCEFGVARLALCIWPSLGRGLGLTLRAPSASMLGEPARWRTIVRAAEAFERSAERLRGQTLGSTPIAVLTGVAPDNPMARVSRLPRRLFAERWRELHRDLAAMSTKGHQIDVDAGHNVHIEAPEKVACAIGEILMQMRGNLA